MLKSANFYWLDWIRFLCALLVVVVHARHYVFVDFGSLLPSEQTVTNLLFFFVTRLGHEAVLFFFVLSGFFVGGKLIQRFNDGSLNIFNYSIDRFSRIYVPLVPVLVLVGFQVYLDTSIINFSSLLGNLLSLQGVLVGFYGGNGPLWSLSYEVWFYIGAGALSLLFSSKKASTKALSLVCIAAFFLVFTKLNPVYILSWCIGAAVYENKSGTKTNSFKLIFASLLLMAALPISQLTSTSGNLPIDITKFRWASDIYLSLSIAFFVKYLKNLKPKGIWVKVDANGAFWASFSYTLYLSHYLLQRILVDAFNWRGNKIVDIDSIGKMVVLIIIPMVFAYLLYLPFERNTSIFRNYLKRKFTESMPKRAVSSSL